MTISEATIVYGGRGVTSKVRSVSAASMSINSEILPAAGEDLTVFIDGVGKFDSRVVYVKPPRIDLAFLTDTQERWRQLQTLRLEIA